MENERKESPRLKMEESISGCVVSKKRTIARGGMIIKFNNNRQVMVSAAEFALYLQPGDSIHKAHNTYDIYVFRGKDKPLMFKL